MAYSVTSWFIDQTQLKTASPVRKFTIAGSDYSSRVVKWPSLRRAYSDIRPVNISVDLSNEDQALNLFRSEPLNLLANCQLRLGYKHSGKGLNFDGTSGYVDWNDIAAQDLTTGLSISVWARPLGVGIGNGWFLMKQNASATSGGAYSLGFIPGTNKVAFSLATSNFSWSDQYSETALTRGEWYHLVGVYASGRRELWINGVMDVSTTGTTGQLVAGAGKLLVGKEDAWTQEQYYGELDDLRLYSQALSSSGIRDLYNGVNVTSLMVGHLGMDEGSGTYSVDSSTSANTATLYSGTTWVDGADELLPLYSGDIDRVMYKKGALTIQTLDKFKQFTERVVGSSNSPALFTGSNYLPSDLAWWLCTSYGGLSAVQGTSNPDIDYAAFNEWASVFSGDSVYIKARFEGPKVTEALRKIARYTDSGIWVEGDKVTFARFAEAGSHETVVTADSILDLSLSIDDSTVVNKQHVYADYDANSHFWLLDIIDVDSTSVNSYGLREEIEKDESIWYVSSATALNMAQRRVLFGAAPYQEYTLSLPLVTLPRQIGEMLRIDDDFLGVTSGEAWRIMEYSLDMNSGKMEVKADSSRIATPFILDHDVYGLLDQDYNSLL